MQYLVDSHCHLDYLKLEAVAGGLDTVLQQARDKGVKQFLTIGVSKDNASIVQSIAEKYADVYCSVGIHPLDLIDKQPVSLAWLLQALDHPKVVAIGETGLDFHYQAETAIAQQASFELHLEAAHQTGKPVIIHTREAKQLTLAILKQAALPQAGVLHCFTEDWEMAKAALDLGYYISLSGIVTFRNADMLRDVAKKVPNDRLLVETDSPYLAPVPYRGKSNLPEYVKEVASFIAELRKMPFEAFAEMTTENFYRLFPLAKPSGLK